MEIIDLVFLILAVLGIIIPTVAYLLWVKNTVNKNKYPTSYSGTYGIWYSYEYRQHIFTAWTAFQTVLLLPALVHYSTNIYEILMGVFALTSLCFVGLFPTSVSKEVTKLHCIFAKVCAIDAIVWLFLKGHYTTTLCLLICGFIWSRLFQRKYETLIMEFMAFLSAYIGIILCSIGV